MLACVHAFSSHALKALQAATTATHTTLVEALIKAGKYNWQAFSNGDGASPVALLSPL